MKYPNVKFNPEWITKENAINDDVVDWTESFGEFLTQAVNDRDNWKKNIRPLTTSQIRKFYGELKRIQADFKNKKDQVPLLKAKLAYAVGRDMGTARAKSKIQEFYEELEKGITAVNGDDKNYTRFVSIVESIVAFHKLHGGRDN
jgi:CRISPR type III-A-associated protein Csm2